ncbi:hypothetical protein [Sinorhizobium sp. BG8]|uniref:hypothetical protein n=1 Tax=Sinorhizobium sp. BG8 TaxID=2613773 RepID=UPI00193D737D|nr:hypothetical protein [Sinorhizobium sp. BG8]QRM55214.1 hypothetical protein F3Y30_12205 [Sinorhizobium sp. BG8]
MASRHHKQWNVPEAARFTIGRDDHGWWVVNDRLGRVGGLFVSEDAALHFAAAECGRNPTEISRAPQGVIVEFGGFSRPASTAGTLARPPRLVRTRH